ncbi:hypothetical protein [Denitrificimonas caeni]|uniref:hypothetical protein n=1 Tax=Denitrificimonas caeni TaxID=521720 RepID=UPI0003B623EE|nr:hypothetical protein [Denitrificimonas caeni]
MVVLEVILAIVIWLTTGHAIYKIYMKAGFKNTPAFVFWIPALNLAFLIYLAFSEWPASGSKA